ncbi:MAG: hypothetical protein HN674_01090 [Candidatus Marinimicrobia bacterium]|jgi:hypothetical protein|nr:hypothetical protein [Candidatus Neomarinimicrobiota bacterium]MBT7821709.1 hypothetical protein [Candidatus Neomarinimicrobiota bacterium]
MKIGFKNNEDRANENLQEGYGDSQPIDRESPFWDAVQIALANGLEAVRQAVRALTIHKSRLGKSTEDGKQ